jgi:small subunit ribosomal protein S17
MSENNESNVNKVTAEPQRTARGRRKTRVGTVVSDKMNKTVVVRVERRYSHPLYGKQVTRSKKYHAHDENNEYQVGDVVRIMETRPLSKLKRWRVVEAIERAK